MVFPQIDFFRQAKRFSRMLFDCNFSGLWHQGKRFLGLRGPVSAPSMPEPDPLCFRTDYPADPLPAAEGPVRTLFFSHDLNLEGASLSLFEMIASLREKKIADPELIAFADGPLRQRYEMSGIPVSVYPLDTDKLSTVKRLERETAMLAEKMERRNPQVVFANTLRTFLAILAANKAEIPSIWNPRESAPWDTFFSYLPDPVARQAIAAVRFPSRVIFVSHASRDIWKNFDRYGNFTVIPNGIDLSRFPEIGLSAERKRFRDSLGVAGDAAAVLCLGTLSERKGQADLIEAMGRLPGKVLEQTQLLFVGDDRGAYAKKLKQRIRSLAPEIQEKIRFFSSTDSVGRFYAASDVFVLCSREESFPRVTLEAMAFGLPIITTPVHGVTEQVSEWVNAFYYAGGNGEDLAGKIEVLIRDDSRRKQMGQSSLERFASLMSFEKMLDAYAAVLRKASKEDRLVRGVTGGVT